MQTPFIDAVLIHRDTHSQLFNYIPYPLPMTSLQPGCSSPCIPKLRTLFHLRIFYTYTSPSSKTSHLPLDPPYFFGYWAYPDDTGYTKTPVTTVIYRDDHKPLHPKQLEVLCRFCSDVFYTVVPPKTVETVLPGDEWRVHWHLWFEYMYLLPVDRIVERHFERLIESVSTLWESFFTTDNFSAFFEEYRYAQLLEGCEEWREVRSPLDV